MKAYRTSFFMLAMLLVLLAIAGFVSSTSLETGVSDPLDSLVSTQVPIQTGSRSLPSNGMDSLATVQPTMVELLEIARGMLENMRNRVHDYRAILIKRERISGALGTEVRMEIKIRNPRQVNGQDKGLAAYLKFTEPWSARGREVIWLENENDNVLVSHEGGFKNLRRFQLAPESMLAMLGNKYPITEIGLMRLIEKLIEKCDRDVDLSRCVVEIIDDQQVGTRECRLFQVTQPKSLPGADFYIAQVFVDVQRNVPLRYAAFLWPKKEGEAPPLEEEYTYLDLELNVGLTDADFDPDNPSYKFP